MSFCAHQLSHLDVLEVTDLSLGPSTDSMIRVGGDYQAQIPEFKPGKLRGGSGGQGGGEISGEKMVHVARNIRGKLGSQANVGNTTDIFTICFRHRKLKSQLLTGKKTAVEIME